MAKKRMCVSEKVRERECVARGKKGKERGATKSKYKNINFLKSQ